MLLDNTEKQETLSQEEKGAWLQKIQNEEVCEYTGPCVVEGIMHKTLPIFGVQWHPELMYKAPVPGAVSHDKLFEYFAYLIRRTYRLRETKEEI